MAHDAAHMTRVENPAEWLGEIASRIDDTRDMAEDNLVGFLPFLDCEMLNVDMM